MAVVVGGGGGGGGGGDGLSAADIQIVCAAGLLYRQLFQAVT